MLLYILRELVSIQTMYGPEFGEMIILFDDWKKDYWRKDVYPAYKASRAGQKAKTKINYTEVYVEVNKLVHQLEENFPWRCVTVDRAEADDTILVLSREYSKVEKILIYSPDKDFIQAQRWTDNVSQYSPLTKKWLVPENKHDSMEHWTLEHVMLGDDSDGVPKVVAHCEFSQSFIAHLEAHDVEHKTPYEFKQAMLCEQTDCTNHGKALHTFEVQKLNRNGEEIGLDIYKDVRFGASTLKKAIEKHGGVDEFLDSHPLYREHYNRNFTLVMEEGIPEYIWNETIKKLNEAKSDYNYDEVQDYLNEHMLFDIVALLPRVFTREEISVDNCGW